MKRGEVSEDYDRRASSRDRGVVAVEVFFVLGHVERELKIFGVFAVKRFVLNLVGRGCSRVEGRSGIRN